MDMAFDAYSDVSDEALLVFYANGDAGGARILTVRLVPHILGYAARLLNDRAEAEDVAQEAMLRLWRVMSRPDSWRIRRSGGLKFFALCTVGLRNCRWIRNRCNSNAALSRDFRPSGKTGVLIDLNRHNRWGMI